MEVFLPAYLDAIGSYAEARIPRATFVPALLESTRAMMVARDASLTNRDAFWSRFEGLTGGRRDELEPFFRRFYAERFPALEHLTRTMDDAKAVVRFCLDRDLEVVIATNPVFPREALVERLRWAGLAEEISELGLVTSYEVMHHTKPHAAYYEEILAMVGCAPERALMVGNDLDADIVPARAVGMHVFAVRSASLQPAAEPSLPELRDVIAHLDELR
jgi:FMN phosphatase YigB (HAD superfamily)